MEYKALHLEVKAEGENAFSGFASTSDLDKGGDIVVKGAYQRTLAQRGSSKVRMLWNHKSDAMPIGKYTLMEEREGGLYVEGKLSDTAAGRDAMTLLKDGAIDSMSIGYIVREADYNEDGVRVIKDLDLLEVSLVNFPMNDKAVVTDVKSVDVRELEHTLRDAGYSRSQAKAIAGAGVARLREASDDEAKEMAQIKAAIEELQGTLTGQEH